MQLNADLVQIDQVTQLTMASAAHKRGRTLSIHYSMAITKSSVTGWPAVTVISF